MSEQSISFMSALVLFGSAQGLLLALALAFMRRGNRRANLLLSALLLTLALGLVDGFLNLANYYPRYPSLIGVIWPANFLVGPLLYFYVKELCSSRRIVFSGKQALHYLPALVYAVLLIPFYALGADGKIRIWSASVAPLNGLRIFSLESAPLLVVLQKALYYIASFMLISAYSSKIKESFSSIEKISLSWLRTLLVLFFSLCFVFTFYSLCASPFGIYREAGYLFYLSSAAVAYILAFKALTRPEIFSRLDAVHQIELIRTEQNMVQRASFPAAHNSEDAGDSNARGKYQKSLLSDQQAAEISRRLVKLVETERLFLEPEITLPELSERLSVSPHQLSQVINKELGKSFFDFINEYRVREAQTLLGSPESSRFSIIGIALDAGFNSKSAFYTAFGKHTGMTPSEFRKRQGWQAQSPSSHVPGSA